MRVTEGLQRLSGKAARRPVLTLGLVVALAMAGGVLALGLKPSAATDTFVSSSSSTYRATVQAQRHFGDDAVVVLVREPLTRLLEPAHLTALTRLEACLAGQYVRRSATLRADVPVRAGSHAAYGGPASPCGRLMRDRPAQVVFGPGTFLNRAVAAVNGGIASSITSARHKADQAARAAYALALQQGATRQQALTDAAAARQAEDLQQLGALERTAAGTGLTTVPSIGDGAFVRQIVFGRGHRARTPQARFSYLFPDEDSALIQVRLKSSLTAVQQARAITLIRRAVAMPQFAAIAGDDVVSGVPVVIDDLSGQITGAVGELLAAAVLVMAAALLLVFRQRQRLLPLAVALAATGIIFGALRLLAVALTLASVAVLPILLGLAVDYGVQFQSRAREGQAGRAAPAIVAAALATAVGFLVLLLSPVPMVRGFGLLLVIGVAVAVACTLTAVPAALALAERDGGVVRASLRGAGEILGPPLRGAAEITGSALRGAVELMRLRGRSAGRVDATLIALARHPLRVLAVGLVLAAAGWVADGHTTVQSDVTKLVPQSMPALRDLHTLEATTGTSGEIDVAVRASDVTSPATVRWMSDYESRLLRHFGYGAGSPGACARATLCPALSLPDLFSGSSGGRGSLTAGHIDAILKAVPAYFSAAVLTPDHREAALAFGIRLMPLADQQRVIDYMRSQLDPPAGVSAALTGLPVLAAEAEGSLSSPEHRLLTLVAGLLAVALALLIVLRRPRRALAPMIPIALATGWSSLVLFLLGIPLNPMSASLGTLVIAISTEFSVLLAERFRQERAAGLDPAAALTRTYRSTGRAVLVSGITAVVGFGVLILSDIAMLRDFGLVTLVDLTVSLAGVLIVLPAALALGGCGLSRVRGRLRMRRPAGIA